MIYAADSGEDFDVVFGEGGDAPPCELGQYPQSFDAAGTVGVFDVELVVAGEVFGEGVAASVEWADQSGADGLGRDIQVFGEEGEDFWAVTGFVAVFAGFEDGTHDRAVGIGVLFDPGFGKSEDFFRITRPDIEVGGDDEADPFLDGLGIPGFADAEAVYFSGSESIDHCLRGNDNQIEIGIWVDARRCQPVAQHQVVHRAFMHYPDRQFALDNRGFDCRLEVLERADAFLVELSTESDGVAVTGEDERDGDRGRGSAIYAQSQG